MRNQFNQQRNISNETEKTDDDTKNHPSKTQIKKQMHDLQELGVLLTKVKSAKLKQLQLPEKLLDAIQATHTITANSALKRQHQYIGKLMRGLDIEDIQLIRHHLIEKGI